MFPTTVEAGPAEVWVPSSAVAPLNAPTCPRNPHGVELGKGLACLRGVRVAPWGGEVVGQWEPLREQSQQTCPRWDHQLRLRQGQAPGEPLLEEEVRLTVAKELLAQVECREMT